MEPEHDRSDMGRHALLLTLGLWAFCFLTFFAATFAGRGDWPPTWAWGWLGAITVTGAVLSGVLYAFIRRQPTRRATPARWAGLALLTFAAAGVQSAIDNSFMFWIARNLGGLDASVTNGAAIVINYLIYFWLFGFYVVALELMFMARRSQALALQARSAELDMLRTQLTPHFLFNALNGVSALVISGRNAEAEVMLERLSRFLRSVFTPDLDNWRTVDAELLAIETFLDLEAPRVRTPPAIRFQVSDDVLEARVPTWILQPLIENAIKFAIIPSGGASGLTVEGRREGERLVLAVIDGGPADGAAPGSGGGVGLANVRRRLQLLYGDEAALTAGPADAGYAAWIELPLRFE